MTSDTIRERPADARDLVVADLVAVLRRAHRLCDTTSERPGSWGRKCETSRLAHQLRPGDRRVTTVIDVAGHHRPREKGRFVGISQIGGDAHEPTI